MGCAVTHPSNNCRPLSFEDNAQSSWNSRIIHDALNNA